VNPNTSQALRGAIAPAAALWSGRRLWLSLDEMSAASAGLAWRQHWQGMGCVPEALAAAADAPMAQLQQYYANHQSEFVEGEVLRLSLPESELSSNGMRLNRATVKNRG